MTINQFFQPAVTACNEEIVSHCQNNKVMVDPEKEITHKDNFRNSPINSDTNQHYNASPIPQSLENSIPNEGESLEKLIPNASESLENSNEGESLENSIPNEGECLENSIPNDGENEVSTLHKETQKEQSHIDLSHIKFDSNMDYWSNFSLENMETSDDIFYDYPPPSTH